LRAIILDLGYTYTCDDTQLQAVAREEGWALIGCLLRYKYGTDLLNMALEDFAKRTGHKELVNLPVISMGFSRNGSRAWDMAEELPDRIIAIGLGGNPGIPANLKNPARVELAQRVPALTVVGSRDPFVDYDKGEARFWHNATYPVIRSHTNVTWGMMIGWGYGHNWEGSWTPFTVFFQETIRLRYESAPDLTGKVKLKLLPFDRGWFGEHGWKTDWPEIATVKSFQGDTAKAIWLPSENVAHVWRAYQVEKSKVNLEVSGEPARLVLTATPPDGTTAVEFFDRAQSIGVAKLAPFSITTDRLRDGVRTVYAVATTAEGKTPSRPLTLASGKALDWNRGQADQKRAEQPENLARLSPSARRTLEAILGGGDKLPDLKEIQMLRKELETLTNDPFVEQRNAAGSLLKRLPAS
jgi:hypothetical protein